MIKKVYLFIFFSFFFTSLSNAQSNFVPGYIVKLNGDTVRGQINDKNWEVNPSSIVFKDQDEKQYTTNDILAFGTPNDIYRRFKTTIIINSADFNNYINYPPKVVRDTTLFLRQLIKSEYILFVLTDKSFAPHFYLEKNDSISTLIYKKQVLVRNGASFLAEENTFRDQLIAILKPDKELENRIKNAHYTVTDIVKIMEKYNEKEGIISSQKSNEKLSYEFDFIAGVSYSNPRFSGSSIYADESISYKNNLQPSAGLGFTIYFLRNRKQFSFDNQLIYASYSSISTGTYKYGTSDNFYDLKFKASYIKLLNIMRYRYPKGAIKPFIGVGVSNGYALNVENNIKKNNETIPLFKNVRKYEQGFVLLLGADYGKFKFEVRNDQTNGIAAYDHTKSIITNYQFSLRYSFFTR